MKSLFYASVLSLLPVSFALAATPALTVTATGIDSSGVIDDHYAFCIPARFGHVQPGQDKSIGLSWYDAPETTKSFAIIAVDTDVPTVFDDANKEGKTIPDALPRKDFYHWVLVNIPATATNIAAGEDSNAASTNGKSERQMPYGLRGINDYAAYMSLNPEHTGIYAGYDGPCPPWNDERIHHYHFKVFALDVAKLELPVSFGATDAMKAIDGHILASGEIVGTYTLNPSLIAIKK